jgi:hypothetical protein
VAEPPREVETDRPDLSNNTIIVPPGSAQLELGFAAGATELDPEFGVPLGLRYGLTERVEIRAFETVDSTLISRARVPGEAAFGVKARLIDSRDDRRWPSLGIQGMINVVAPAGAAILIWSQPMGRRVMLDTNFAVIGSVYPGGRFVGFTLSTSLGVQATKRLFVYGELFGALESRAPEDAIPGGDTGVIVSVLRWLAVDFSVRTTMRAPVSWAGIVGFTMLVGG